MPTWRRKCPHQIRGPQQCYGISDKHPRRITGIKPLGRQQHWAGPQAQTAPRVTYPKEAYKDQVYINKDNAQQWQTQKKLPDPKRTRKRANQRAGYENTGEERFNVRGLHKSAPSPAIHVQRGGPLKGFIYPRPKRWPIKGIYHMQQNCRERRKTLTHPRLEAKRRTLHVP